MSKIKVNSIEAATGSTITIPSGQTLDISATTLTLPSTVVTTTGTQTLTNKTIGVSQLSGTIPTTIGGTGLTTLGTAAQVLRVNSGATALEFATPAVATSDFVHLGTVTVSGTPTTVSLDGYFSATYKHYKIMWDKVGGNNAYLAFRVNISGSANSSSNYFGNHHYSYVNSSAALGDGVYSAGWGATRFELDNDNFNGATVNRQTGELTLFNPQSTTYSKSWIHQSQCFNGAASHFWSQTGAGQYTTNYAALTGVTFLYDTGSTFLNDGEFRIYGIKG